MRERNTRIGRATRSCGNTRNHRERNTRVAQCFQLFATTAKNKRIATFQPHHAFAFLRFPQQDLVNLFLRYTVVSRAFADENAISIAAYQIHNIVRNQTVVDHHICLLNLLQSFQRQQPGIARTCTNQHHFTAMVERFVD